ncbi:MAG: His-Xaa-Ser system-associated MauG-like protein [Allorhizobium sp.]
MKFDTRPLSIVGFLGLGTALYAVPVFADGLREQVLRDAAKRGGFVPAEETYVPVDSGLAAAGKLLFQSKTLSLDRQTACATCHLDRFGSSDGLPNAIGTKGHGEGLERLSSGGDIIPRNTMPFWGVGGVGYDVLFWDGKVDNTSGTVESQFGERRPSSDPLVVAAHIPPVEIREMISDTPDNESLQTEDLGTVDGVYRRLLDQLLQDQKIGASLSSATGKLPNEIEFLDVARALAAFIRDNFKLNSTKLHEFVFKDGILTEQEVAGGLVFFGKGRCGMCHNGPYFSDMRFHAVPFPQAGFGKNGFGIDYGRFNVTLNPADRYKFRTPPLYNVSKTAPYSHSGSVDNLADVIRIHVDPLAMYDPGKFTDVQRAEYYQALKAWSQEPLVGIAMDDDEVDALVAFLATLEYDSQTSVRETE